MKEWSTKMTSLTKSKYKYYTKYSFTIKAYSITKWEGSPVLQDIQIAVHFFFKCWEPLVMIFQNFKKMRWNIHNIHISFKHMYLFLQLCNVLSPKSRRIKSWDEAI